MMYASLMVLGFVALVVVLGFAALVLTMTILTWRYVAKRNAEQEKAVDWQKAVDWPRERAPKAETMAARKGER